MIKNLESVFERMENCSSVSVGLVRPDGSEFDVPVTCNNRACEICESHRGYLHVRNHFAQMEYAKDFIENPKSFIFTGWRLNGMTHEAIRSFAQKKLSRLVWVLSSINLDLVNQGRKPSPYCVYMEFKIYEDSSLYLHFHVVSGTIGDFHHAQALWGRYVRYEYPIVSEDRLLRYVRKYTSKVPMVYSDHTKARNPLSVFPELKSLYVSIVYKLQMARYSERRQICIDLYGKREPRAFLYAMVLSELYGSLRSGRGRGEFIPYLDRPPPLESDDVPSCVYVFPSEPVSQAVLNSYNPVLPRKRSKSRSHGGFLKVTRNPKGEAYIVDEASLNRSVRRTWRRNSEAFLGRLREAYLEQSGRFDS